MCGCRKHSHPKKKQACGSGHREAGMTAEKLQKSRHLPQNREPSGSVNVMSIRNV